MLYCLLEPFMFVMALIEKGISCRSQLGRQTANDGRFEGFDRVPIRPRLMPYRNEVSVKANRRRDTKDVIMFALNGRLQLIRHAEDRYFVEERLAFRLGDTECPAAAVEVLWILPHGFYSLSEDVNSVSKSDFVPRVIIVDSIEGCDVGNVFVQDIESVVIIPGVSVFVVPHRPVVLERQGPELANDILMEGLAGGRRRTVRTVARSQATAAEDALILRNIINVKLQVRLTHPGHLAAVQKDRLIKESFQPGPR